MNSIFQWKQKLYLTTLLIISMVILLIPIMAKAQQTTGKSVEQSSSETANLITFLNVDYQLDNQSEAASFSVETSFKGALDRVAKLREISRELPVDITTRADEKGQHISLIVRDKDSYDKIVNVFSGTEIEQALKSVQGKTVDSSKPIALNIGYQHDDGEWQKFELHSKNQDWVSFKTDRYQLEIKPTLTEVDGEQMVLINARITDISSPDKDVIGEPAIMTLVDSEASIEVGQEDAQGRFSGFKMSVVPTLL